jgi:hypothetical protein
MNWKTVEESGGCLQGTIQASHIQKRGIMGKTGLPEKQLHDQNFF